LNIYLINFKYEIWLRHSPFVTANKYLPFTVYFSLFIAFSTPHLPWATCYVLFIHFTFKGDLVYILSLIFSYRLFSIVLSPRTVRKHRPNAISLSLLKLLRKFFIFIQFDLLTRQYENVILFNATNQVV